jgi:hypothetical protein
MAAGVVSRRRVPDRNVLPVVCTNRGKHRKVPISQIALSGTEMWIKGTAYAKKPDRPDDLTSFTFHCPMCGRDVSLRAEFVKENLLSGTVETYIDISHI